MSGQDVLKNSGFTGCLGNADLQEGTNAGTIETQNAVDFVIDGIAYTKGATDNIATGAAAQQAVSTSCLYLIEIDADGAVSMKKGTERLTADLGDNLSLQWPTPSADKCPIGGVKIALNSSTTFTLGTTDLGAAGVTDTFYNFALGMPLAPQVA